MTHRKMREVQRTLRLSLLEARAAWRQRPLALNCATDVFKCHRRQRAIRRRHIAAGEIVQIAYARYVTFRFKATVAGSLQLDYIRPVATGPILDSPAMPLASYQKYTSPASPAAVVTVANVESSLQVTTSGEFWCLLTFTPSAGPGVVTYCDVSAT